MNVGSILNNDTVTPTSTDGQNASIQSQSEKPSYQRHSIDNLLNEPTTTKMNSTPEISMSKDSPRESIKNEQESFGHSLSTTVETGDSMNREKEQEENIKKVKSNIHIKKPKRYKEPPIWAREWVTSQQNGYETQDTFNNVSVLSDKRVFNPSETVSTDLECSVTGTIPPPSLTRAIAEWIYANFIEIRNDQRKFIELELKFGNIMDKRSGQRLDINVSTECIYTDTAGTYFEMGIHEVGWKDMCEFLEELEKVYEDELRNMPPNKPKRKFGVLQTDTTDNFFHVSNRNEQPKSVRISTDNLLDPPRYLSIDKRRLSNLYIYNPSSMYDLRLSLSLEIPVPESESEPLMKKSQPNLTRIKKRTSWTHVPTVTRFDMTKVLQPRQLKSKAGKRITEQDESYEVELEIDTTELFIGFDNFRNGTNSIRFEELVEVFVNNARCLNNRVTKLANR